MAPKLKRRATKRIKPSPMLTTNQPSITKEIINESTAGLTDSIFTQFCLAICYYLFNEIDFMQNYFQSTIHIYWIFYFIHVNILDSYIWGSSYRNSVNYIYDKLYIQSIFRTLTVIFCQYLSVYIGVWLSIKFVHFYFNSSDPSLALQLQYTFVGRPEFPSTLSQEQYLTFIWQSLFFQILDRIINGLIMTISPLLKQRTYVFDGRWMQITWRCLFMHFLIVNGRIGVVNNPNYSFYACLYYWRWSLYDIIILILPYCCIVIYKLTFANMAFLHNPGYFVLAKNENEKENEIEKEKETEVKKNQ